MVSRYERGLAEPGASVLMQLRAAGVNIDFVLFGELAPQGNSYSANNPKAGYGMRLREEREKRKWDLSLMAEIGGVTLAMQLAMENEKWRPEEEYLEAVAADVDVSYVLTGHRMHMQTISGAVPSEPVPAASIAIVGERPAGYAGGPRTVMRELTPEEAALVDNYNAADEKGKAAARSVLDALAEPKKRANG